jgi:hypothetical protein
LKGRQKTITKPEHITGGTENKKNGWMKSNNFLRGKELDSLGKIKRPGNIYDYNIETRGNYAGYIDVESSTRKRSSKTAAGKKRPIVSINNCI